MLQAIKSFEPNYDPKILYMFINKRITTRLFEKNNGHQVINPGPGTIVDRQIVENDSEKLFDFFMIANENPSTATALPVHYEVAMNTTELSKREIELLTYHQCYNYFGFGGPIKVPATAFYAHKVAYYAYDNGFNAKTETTEVNPSLLNQLHFL